MRINNGAINELEKNGKIFAKFKSVEVIYQEGNSVQSNSYNPSFFKKEKEGHQQSQAQTPVPDKKLGDDDEFSNGLSPGDLDSKDKNNSYLRDHKAGERKDRSLNEEPFSTRSLFQKKDTDNLSVMTPKSRKLDLHFQSTPIRPKILDTRYDNPDHLSSVVDTKDPKRTLNLSESIIIRKPNNEFLDDKNILEIPEPQYSMGLNKANTSPVKLQQLSEQIETLASETMKIIDEIRNKKRNTINTFNDIQYIV